MSGTEENHAHQRFLIFECHQELCSWGFKAWSFPEHRELLDCAILWSGNSRIQGISCIQSTSASANPGSSRHQEFLILGCAQESTDSWRYPILDSRQGLASSRLRKPSVFEAFRNIRFLTFKPWWRIVLLIHSRMIDNNLPIQIVKHGGLREFTWSVRIINNPSLKKRWFS